MPTPGRNAFTRSAPSPAPYGCWAARCPVVPVRTQGEVPKEKVLEVARALHTAAVPAPVQAGQVVLADVCGTGVAVVATKNIG